MDAGRLNKRVTIQSRGAGVDSFGAPNGTWTDIATVWASVSPLRGQERMNTQQTQADIDHKITVRYRPGLVAKQRLKYGVRLFDIESVIDINERHETVEMMCKEAV